MWVAVDRCRTLLFGKPEAHQGLVPRERHIDQSFDPGLLLIAIQVLRVCGRLRATPRTSSTVTITKSLTASSGKADERSRPPGGHRRQLDGDDSYAARVRDLHPWAVARFTSARVARLGTVSASGRPIVVPVVFVVVGDVLWSAVDAKPKLTRRLARLTNIMGNPAVSVLVDYYEEDWLALWWVRADGIAEVMDAVSGQEALAVGALAVKYPQYATDPPQGPFIRVRLQRWSSWAAG